MTWLGKIFALLVLVLSLALVWFITTAWVTRTNWKTEAERYKVEYKKSLDARQAEYDAYRTRAESLEGTVGTLQARLTSVEKLKDAMDVENIANRANNEKLTADLAGYGKQVADQNAAIAAAEAKTREAQALLVTRENEAVQLLVAANKAEREATAALASEARQRGVTEEFARRVEALNNQIAELRALGIDPSKQVEGKYVLTPPVPESLRGSVTAVSGIDPDTKVQGDLVAINIGLDAGLQRGSVLDIARMTNGGLYLGTVVIDTVYPKHAVAVFKPAGGKPLKSLKPHEFPKAGDVVRKPEESRLLSRP